MTLQEYHEHLVFQFSKLSTEELLVRRELIWNQELQCQSFPAGLEYFGLIGSPECAIDEVLRGRSAEK